MRVCDKMICVTAVGQPTVRGVWGKADDRLWAGEARGRKFLIPSGRFFF